MNDCKRLKTPSLLQSSLSVLNLFLWLWSSLSPHTWYWAVQINWAALKWRVVVMILVTSPVSDFSVSMQTGSGRPATGRSDAAGLRHVLHATAAQYRHSQEEAQHQTIQGSPINAHLWRCFTFAFISFSLCCLKISVIFLIPGGAFLTAQWRVRVVLWDGAHRGVSGGSH